MARYRLGDIQTPDVEFLYLVDPTNTATLVNLPDGKESQLTLPTGSVTATTISPSGDATGATDTSVIQTALNAAAGVGGGLVRLTAAPDAAPFWITQLAIDTGVTLAGAGRIATVLKAPLGQVLNTHMLVLKDPAATTNIEVRDLTVHGNNGFAATHPITWGQQTNSFDGINFFSTAGGSGLASLFLPFHSDRLLQITNVNVVSCPTSGIALSGNGSASSVIRSSFVYWTGGNGFNLGAYDTIVSDCISGHSGVALTTPTANTFAGFKISGGFTQLSNCKAWWPQTKFTEGTPVTFSAPVGVGFYLTAATATEIGNCFAQDCGTGFLVNGSASDARIRGQAQNCSIGAGIWNNNDNIDLDVNVMYFNDGSLVSPKYAFAAQHGASVGASRISVKFNSAMSFSQGPAFCDTNGAGTQGSQTNISSAARQTVAFTSTFTPAPYYGQQIVFGVLTGNVTINAPQNDSGVSSTGVQPYDGQEMELWLTQDATGGRTVTFASDYLTSAAIPTTANKTTIIRFRWEAHSLHWWEISRATQS